MRAITIKDAKAHLNELIEAATRGEQVVLMRGSKHVATIVPITDADLELSPTLGDAQAARFWQSLERDRAAGTVQTHPTAGDAVRALESPRKSPAKAKGKSASRTAKR